MRIGYACIALGRPGSKMKSCILRNANEQLLLSLIASNLDSLNQLIEYNIRNNISLFRISSDLIPFGSSVAANLPWQALYAQKLAEIGTKIKNSGMRVSMHPGQYTVLNSPDESVAQRAVQDLEYHTRVLDSLGVGAEHKIILHLGGAYGDKNQAIKRFVSRYQELNPAVKSRLVLENDDKIFNIDDVLITASATGIPAVFDNLHHAVNPAGEDGSEFDWIHRCSETWSGEDGPQKIHYSQQHPDKKRGAHSDFIAIDPFLEFYHQISNRNIDIILEVKDKNLSALKCIHCVSNLEISILENEWAHYKYSVLERSAEHYNAIRKLLKDKNTYPAIEMYHLIEDALRTPLEKGNAINAAQHVWGYFKDKASTTEKRRFQDVLHKLEWGNNDNNYVKSTLFAMANKYQEQYLLNSYYLYI
ncbi:MAG: UV DNA damage repair endonuclease UvsE [Thermoclostridium sp.]|nr:UV DNA damage repair endonuclease UvsE [Thermoclostridium sp.]